MAASAAPRESVAAESLAGSRRTDSLTTRAAESPATLGEPVRGVVTAVPSEVARFTEAWIEVVHQPASARDADRARDVRLGSDRVLGVVGEETRPSLAETGRPSADLPPAADSAEGPSLVGRIMEPSRAAGEEAAYLELTGFERGTFVPAVGPPAEV